MQPQLNSKLNFIVILNPVPAGRDVVTGTLPGDENLEIEVARRWAGWTPLLRITIAGHTIHSEEASKSAQEQFDELQRRARAANFRALEDQSAQFLKTAKAAQLWIDSLL